MTRESPFDLMDLIIESHDTAVQKGWWNTPDGQPRSMGDQFANFHAELSEAWEEYRAGKPLDEITTGDNGKPEGFTVELADLFIRVCDTIGNYRLEAAFVQALLMKLSYNQTRPYRHGNKLA
jgi:hypothetical protein